MMYEQDGSIMYGVDSKLTGQGLYSASKLAQQQVLIKFSCIKSTVIPCIIGGPGRRGLFVGFVNNIDRFGYAVLPGPCINKTSIVHVKDVCSLIIKILTKRASGFYNVAPIDSLSVTEWAQLTGNQLGKNVRIFRLPLSLVKYLAYLTCYRALAREQVLMLIYPHVLDVQSSLALGWQPEYNTAEVVNELVSSILEERTTGLTPL
jgi:nucleoside-diphosphate-sugar epimerase